MDEAAFLRIVNVPPRQIGPKAKQALAAWAAGVNAQKLAAEMAAEAEVRLFTFTARRVGSQWPRMAFHVYMRLASDAKQAAWMRCDPMPAPRAPLPFDV